MSSLGRVSSSGRTLLHEAVVVVVVLYYYYIIFIVVVDKHPTWLHPIKALQTKIIAEEVSLPPV